MADPFDELLALWEPTIKSAFLGAVKDHRDQIDMAEIVRRLEAGDVNGALEIVGVDRASFLPLDRAIEAAFLAAGLAYMASMKRRPRFDFRALTAQTWLEQHLQVLIHHIVDDQQAMLRAQMVQAASARQLARDIVGVRHRVTGRREGALLGLTAQHAEWARNYERELSGVPSAAALTRKLREPRFDAAVRAAIAESRPLDAKTRASAVAAYRNRALRSRATGIALSEASAALHQGEIEAWGQAAAKGFVSVASLKRFWITARDDRVRATHRAVPIMNPNGVGLHEPFQTPKGLAMQPGWSFDPGCRCHAKVVVVASTMAFA